MKLLRILLFLSVCFTQELKVEGNLNVTGAVINDSLVQVIDSLKVELEEHKSLIEELQEQILQLGEMFGLVDCNGQFNGDAIEDECGICDNDASNDCLLDCTGNWGGSVVLDACGLCGGDAVSEDECFIEDIDGNLYETVWVGEQLWMAENLKTTHYTNGDAITHITNNGDWESYNEGQYGVYNNDPTNADIYGNLYNWAVVDDSRGVCPVGWHVPTDDEYTVLTDFLSGTSVAGGKMKEAGLEHWNSPNTGATNESGFTGLPAGYRSLDIGSYLSMGYYEYFWSSTEYDSFDAWYRLLNVNSSGAHRNFNDKRLGFSVRCLRD
jgi:uncharacterized protein (TIGR02145 family)